MTTSTGTMKWTVAKMPCGVVPFLYCKISKRPTKPKANSSLYRVSSHPLCHSMLVAPHMFQENLFKCRREALHHGSRYGLRLIDDGVGIAGGNDRNHAPLLPHRLHPIYPLFRELHRVRKYHLQPLVLNLNIVEGAAHDHLSLVDNSNVVGDQFPFG